MAKRHREKQKSIMRGGGNRLVFYVKGTDWLTLLLCLCASACGLVLVHSATLRSIPEDGGMFSRDTVMMAVSVALGVMLALLMSFLDYELMLRFWFVIAGGCLLLMLMLIPFGWAPENRADAKSWLTLPIPGFEMNLQPSELLKIGFIISFTWHLHRVQGGINKLLNIAMLGVHAMIPFGLVILTGDLGSALVFLCITAGMLFLAGLKLRFFAAMAALAGAAAPVLWVTALSTFQKERVYAVYARDMLTEESYEKVIHQQQRAQYAIGSGQLFGKGLFRGDYTQSGAVPVNESDMIFSVAGEELGFVGAAALLLLLALLIIRLVRVSSRTRNTRARLLCGGVALMIGAQAVINIGMCLKLLPVIGITLPFFSAGGSSNLCLYLTIGLVLTVFRHQNEHEDTQSYFDYLYS
ncbi:MAG: FtsW/RodA/SpoVE family cell cycle protein [Oscillospiraceae bacterium]|jgi:rod shape determining protein RodA|nr:FtsW/RodA/SpoVE family cell cycle protein [Oscillospiraceae bacterium]